MPVPASKPNPFDITKASEFTDEQIAAYFVDMPGPGFAALANPKSPMPMLIWGGKGCGKTHLMRYFSYSLQKLRHRNNISRGLTEEGYLGVYFRCGGLNSGRFKGKGQSDEIWRSIFAYYMELWLAQLLLTCANDFLSQSGQLDQQNSAVHKCLELFDKPISFESVNTLSGFQDVLHALQRDLDSEVNNCALTKHLNVRILATPGRLAFGIPQILTSEFQLFSGLRILYLFDEYENLMEPQQRYVNTLLREKELPCSFKIGGRVYGFKTFKTYSDDEEIKEGSEYEVLPLDARLRDNRQYGLFAQRLSARRLMEAGYMAAGPQDIDAIGAMLPRAFEAPEASPLLLAETSFVIENYRNRERPYFTKLRRRLEKGRAAAVAPGVNEAADIDLIIRLLEVPDLPILEKVNIFKLYQGWRTSEDLKSDSRAIAEQCRAFLAGDNTNEYAGIVEKRKHDLLAQLLRDCEQKQQYLGFQTFVDMSEGLPRNLLVILKSVFNWSTFNGENPFSGGRISTKSQRAGVREAADWFFDDARMPGDDGTAIRAGVSRLATLFREIRFSDKPSEKAICTFSCDLSQCSPEAERIIRLAEKWSLLIGVSGGQRDRNSMRVDAKFYINPMLAPKWDLPVARGGALELGPADVNSIFDPVQAVAFESTMAERISRMNAPFFGSSERATNEASQQHQLPLNPENA